MLTRQSFLCGTISFIQFFLQKESFFHLDILSYVGRMSSATIEDSEGYCLQIQYLYRIDWEEWAQESLQGKENRIWLYRTTFNGTQRM